MWLADGAICCVVMALRTKALSLKYINVQRKVDVTASQVDASGC